MGLRDKNKSARQNRIVEKAAELFRKKGYDAARIEEIAAAADVSVGTIYNYYENKGDILVAIVALEVNEVMAAGEKIVSLPPKNAISAVNALVETYIDHSLFYLSKDLWRRAMSITIAEPQSPFGKRYVALDKALTAQVRALVQKLKSASCLTLEADSETLGEVIFNNTNMMFMDFVRDEKMSQKRLRFRLRRVHQTLLSPFLNGASG